eukprot:gb/GECG01013761.1/.p1 GENE.gb/GECG01013761.1/~~gb/GECG01013761.1/.p1  ORF type:complete len:448 (+),score=86.28 gb/GECG01013761.1/:1-1344(+)
MEQQHQQQQQQQSGRQGGQSKKTRWSLAPPAPPITKDLYRASIKAPPPPPGNPQQREKERESASTAKQAPRGGGGDPREKRSSFTRESQKSSEPRRRLSQEERDEERARAVAAARASELDSMVSRDPFTKQKATMSFIRDPSMDRTLRQLRNDRDRGISEGTEEDDEGDGDSDKVEQTMESFKKTQDTLMKTRHDSQAQFESLLRPTQKQPQRQTQMEQEDKQVKQEDYRVKQEQRESSPAPGRMMPTVKFARGVDQIEKLSVATSRGTGGQGTEGFSPRRKMDTMVSDIKIQQLRGIFAGFDENRDNVLEREEITNALLSLGIKPTKALVNRFFGNSSLEGCVDLATFIRTSLQEVGDAESTLSDVSKAFSPFDYDKTGIVDVGTLRHLLTQVQTGSELTQGEADDLLQMIGINSGSNFRDKLDARKANINYRQLIDAMMFAPEQT